MSEQTVKLASFDMPDLILSVIGDLSLAESFILAISFVPAKWIR